MATMKVLNATEKLEAEAGLIGRVWSGALGLAAGLRRKVSGFLGRAWELGADDPRKVIHGLKVGLSLTLVSLFYYLRPLYDGFGGNAMWAVMTVVVVSEFTVGGTLYKAFNRVTATSLAGSLAFAVHSVASRSGDRGEPVVQGAALFLLASAATFSRFIPAVKARFDYGVTIFILTFSLVSVSGYRVGELLPLAQQRLSTVAMGCSLCLAVGLLVRPVWAGADLHLLLANNIEKLATSLEACVAQYFEDDGDGKPSQKSQGYVSVLNGKALEDSLANLARWEPAHGHFSFRHPWRQYLNVGTAVRHCAYCVEALNASISSAAEVPEFVKKHLRCPCIELTSQCSRTLTELATSMKSMTTSSAAAEMLLEDMNRAVEELEAALKSLPDRSVTVPPLQADGETGEGRGKQHPPPSPVPLMDLLPVVTSASVLIEVSARVQGVADAVAALASLARFGTADDDDIDGQGDEEERQENLKGLQIV